MKVHPLSSLLFQFYPHSSSSSDSETRKMFKLKSITGPVISPPQNTDVRILITHSYYLSIHLSLQRTPIRITKTLFPLLLVLTLTLTTTQNPTTTIRLFIPSLQPPPSPLPKILGTFLQKSTISLALFQTTSCSTQSFLPHLPPTLLSVRIIPSFSFSFSFTSFLLPS